MPPSTSKKTASFPSRLARSISATLEPSTYSSGLADSQPRNDSIMANGCRMTSQSQLTLRITRSEEHTSELQSLMRISYAVFCLKKKTQHILQANVACKSSQRYDSLLVTPTELQLRLIISPSLVSS